jgi:predicted anti-sigma-YlaC factor YlaD
MRSPIPSDECARASEWASLRLDGQLSDFEEVLLEAHLARCPDCRGVVAGMIGAVQVLRSTRLEQPAVTFEAPRRRRGRTAGLLAASAGAAAAVAVVGLSGLVSLHISTHHARLGPTADPKVIELKERQMDEFDGSQRVHTGVRPSLAEQASIGAPASPASQTIPRDFFAS